MSRLRGDLQEYETDVHFLCYPSWDTDLLQGGVVLGAAGIVRHEEQECGPFAQLLLQQGGLGARGLQPAEDRLLVLEHPAADALRREVLLAPGEDLPGEEERRLVQLVSNGMTVQGMGCCTATQHYDCSVE